MADSTSFSRSRLATFLQYMTTLVVLAAAGVYLSESGVREQRARDEPRANTRGAGFCIDVGVLTPTAMGRSSSPTGRREG